MERQLSMDEQLGMVELVGDAYGYPKQKEEIKTDDQTTDQMPQSDDISDVYGYQQGNGDDGYEDDEQKADEIFKLHKLQGKLFDQNTVVQDEWQGMPEFVQDDLTSYRQIQVHFRNPDDVREFAQLIEQRIGPKQKYLWYPEMTKDIWDKKYYDE